MPTRSAAAVSVPGASSSSPEKWRTRRLRSSARSASGACRRAATTARQAGTVADMRGRSDVSIGMWCSADSLANAWDWRSGVNPLSS